MGVLGHVDSGKTSLTRALSTVASTASMDKSPQSKERGITLDLGFSSFVMDVPAHLVAQGSEHEQMQITLVDCPGHASLIRTIIGGAQIIDLMLLVIDVGKGIQTQTAECLVIGEITNDRLIVVLNKLDVLPAATREADLEKMKARIRKTLSTTKFADAPMVAVAAHPGGGTDYADAKPPPETTGAVIGAEPAAESGAVGGASDARAACAAPTTAPEGIAELLAALRAQIVLPQRDPDGPLLFAIDHCFPIKGQGTVVTGTVLSGSLGVGMEIDFPELKQTRKIKSMQMFKKPVTKATQGDRVGVCVTQLDSKALERGIACTQGHVTLISAALVSVRQIRFFKAACRTGVKFHITVGHTTVMGTTTFFGPPRDAPKRKSEEGLAVSEEEKAKAVAAAVALARTPLRTHFDATAEYEHCDELDPDSADQWAVIQLETPVPCALPAVAIGSHLDGASETSSCRLAFHGLMLRAVSDAELHALKIFKRKVKEGQIERVQDANTVICKALFSPGTDMNLFVGMTVQLGDDGPVGRIDGTFGKTKFKCVFPDSAGGVEGLQEACHKSRLLLRYKRFVFDPAKRMIQTT